MKDGDFPEQPLVATSAAFHSDTKVGNSMIPSESGGIITKKDINKYVPYRETPEWVISDPAGLSCRADLIKVLLGQAPVGVLPEGTLLKHDLERTKLLETLLSIPDDQYSNTDTKQRLSKWGRPFVDSESVDSHLRGSMDERIKHLSVPLVNRIGNYFKSHGFNVAPMIDPVTSLRYTAGVFRKISVSNSSSVLHTDDFIRDGLMKPDFRIPTVLGGQMYYQASINILLDDGGYQPDPLFVYNRLYNYDDEESCLGNGWQFPLSLVADSRVCRYDPRIGETYIFCTNQFHDVHGGSPLSERITWSVFTIYLPSLNLILLYN